MSDQPNRPEDEATDEGPSRAGDQQAPAGEDSPGGSVLAGFSWDDPGAVAAAREGDRAPAAPAAEAPEEPAAAAAAPGPDGPSDPYRTPQPGQSAPQPDPSAPGAYQPGQYQPDQNAPGPYAPGPYAPGPYAPGPYAPGQQPGYGTGAPYTSTPQPYPYSEPPLSPEAEKARTNAILWTILNGIAIFLTGNLFSIAGVILAAISINRVRTDVASARNLTRWSWILFAAWYALGLVLVVVLILALVFGTVGVASGF